jgi:hypothetical protein
VLLQASNAARTCLIRVRLIKRRVLTIRLTVNQVTSRATNRILRALKKMLRNCLIRARLINKSMPQIWLSVRESHYHLYLSQFRRLRNRMQIAPQSSLSLEWILFFLFSTESWVRDQVAKLFNTVEFKIGPPYYKLVSCSLNNLLTTRISSSIGLLSHLLSFLPFLRSLHIKSSIPFPFSSITWLSTIQSGADIRDSPSNFPHLSSGRPVSPTHESHRKQPK